MNRAREIINRSFIYAIGNILRGIASFVMLPIYTRYLAPRDYGVIELISVVLDLALLLLGARVAVGVYKFYSDANTEDAKRSVIATSLALMIGVHALAVTVIIILNKPIARLLDVSSDFGLALSVYSLSAVFAAANEVFFSYLKIRDRAVTYVIVNFVKLCLQLALNIVLVAYWQLNYWGVVWSAVISSAAMAAGFSVALLPKLGLKVSRAYAQEMVRFSAPIVLASLAMYYITFSSRYFLEYFASVDAVGLYALANKFGVMIFTLVAVPFSDYWSARQFDMAKAQGADRLFGQVFFYLVVIMFGAGAGLLALVSDFVHMSATELYWSALPAIPWIAGAYALQAWGDYFRFGFFYTSNNRYITYASFATAVVITGLYVFWIPRDGVLGAGKASFVASLVRFLIVYFFGQRFFGITVPWVRVFGCAAYFAGVVFAASLLPFSGTQALLAKGFFVSVFFVAFFFTPLIEREHRAILWRQISPGTS